MPESDCHNSVSATVLADFTNWRYQTSNNQQDPSLRLLNAFLWQEYPISTHGENQIFLFVCFFFF
jgi:hypothetical protein